MIGDLKAFLKRWGKSMWSYRWVHIASIISLAISEIVSLIFKTRGPRDSFAHLFKLLGPHATQIAIGFLVLLAGGLAHWFKGKHQKSYGYVEVYFGTISGFSIALATSASHLSMTQWASLVGCVYVIARGLNNVIEANARKEAEIMKGILESLQKSADIVARLPAVLSGTVSSEPISNQ